MDVSTRYLIECAKSCGNIKLLLYLLQRERR